MPLFSIPKLREEYKEYVRNNPLPTIAVARSDLGPGDATHILNTWALELEDYARRLGYKNIVDISGPNLTYERMTDILQATKPAVLFNFSHGCQNYLIGNDLRCTLTRGWEDTVSCGVCGMPSNLKTISGTAIIAYSCHSAYQLGKCAVRYGAPAYVGFADSLIIVSDAFGTQTLFKESLMPLAYHILEGWSVGAAVEAINNDLLNIVKQHKSVELVAVPLMYDRKYLSLLGDPNWKLLGE